MDALAITDVMGLVTEIALVAMDHVTVVALVLATVAMVR